MGISSAIGGIKRKAFDPIFDELGGLKSVPDIDRRGREEIRAENKRRARDAESATSETELPPVNWNDTTGFNPAGTNVQGSENGLGGTDAQEGENGANESAGSQDSDTIDTNETTNAQESVSEFIGSDGGEGAQSESEGSANGESNLGQTAEYAYTKYYDYGDEDDIIDVDEPPESCWPRTPEEPEPEETQGAPEPEERGPEPEKPEPEREPEKVEEPKSAPEPPQPQTPESEEPEKSEYVEIVGDKSENVLATGPEIGATGLSRLEKERLADDYNLFADRHCVSEELMDVLAGAMHEMEPEQLEEFKKYVSAVRFSRLKIGYRDALHKSPTVYASEELAMAAVTEGFVESQYLYLEKALGIGALSQDELVSPAYFLVSDDGNYVEISKEAYLSEIDALEIGSIRANNPPLSLEPQDVHRLAQSVDAIDRGRGVDELVVRLLKELVFFNTGARRLAESTFAEIDELANMKPKPKPKPKKRVAYEACRKEYETLSAACDVVRDTGGDSAFTALLDDEKLVSMGLVKRIEYFVDPWTGKRIAQDEGE